MTSLTILHAEDNEIVADAVRLALEAEGWKVVTCTDGAAALIELASPNHYDLLVADNDLPHVDGLELIDSARMLRHRMRLPAVMLTATDCEREAMRVGAAAYLRKPEGVAELVPTIKRLLNRGA